MKYSKKNKIVDCFFFYDEIDMLKFRLTELYDYVDYFILIEGTIDFRNNTKSINFNLEDDAFSMWKDKIIHLVYDRFDKSSLLNPYKEIKYQQKIKSFDESSIKKNDIIDFAIFSLQKKILSMDLAFDDVVLLSDVDEIPDLSNTDIIMEYLKFDQILLRQKNFVWTTEFIDTYPHFGTCVFNKSKILTDLNSLMLVYERKNEVRGISLLKIDNGYHFSHFYDYEKTLIKLNLLYDSTDKVALTKQDVLESMKNLVHPSQINKPILCSLVEYRGVLPKNIEMLKNQSIGRLWSKNFLVLINPSDDSKIDPAINDYHQHFFINFTDEYVKITRNDNEFDIFHPNEVLYHEFPLERFRYSYCLNEINKILNKHLLIGHDFVILSLNNYIPSNDEITNNLKKSKVYFDAEKKYVVVSWNILRDKIISDFIAEIL
jgi:hypothetical protein